MANPYTLEVVRQVATVTNTEIHVVFVPGVEFQFQPAAIRDKREDDNHPSVHWIKDFLPADLPTATILKFRYERNLIWTSRSIENHGKNLLLELSHFRASQAQKHQPIIFIGHSLGGLIIKQALATSSQSQDNATYGKISQATKGIIFLGTPHSSRPSLVRQLEDILRANIKGADQIIHRMGATYLDSDILDGFRGLMTWIAPWFKIISFFEELPVPGQKIPVVGPDDAEIPGHSKLPVYAHHLNIAQFHSHTSAAYLQIVASLKSIWQLTSLCPSLYEAGSAIYSSVLLPLSISRLNEGLRSIPEAAAGTCSWILDTALFQTWLQQESGIFWVQGKRGSGKSTLLRFVAQKLLNRPTAFGLNSTASFYFFSFSHGGIRSTGGDVVDFLRHLMAFPQEEGGHKTREGSICSIEIQDTETKPAQDHTPVSNLNKSLASVQNTPFQDSIILFIDDIDEYEESTTVITFIWAILSRLPAFYSFRVFISSRLQPQFEQVSHIRLEDNNSTDIWRYCRSRLMTKDLEYRDFLAQQIASRANGVFLWVKLVVSQLGHIHSRIDIGQIQLPSDLSEAFRWTMDHILDNTKNADITKTLLRWATFARRPLSIYEIQHALGTASFICSSICEDCNEGDIEPASCFLEQDELSYRHIIIGLEILTWGLLEVVNDTVYFAHYSVKDHLLRRITTQERPDTSHQELALACLEYLRGTISDLGDTLEKDEKPTKSIYPFLEYATFYWMHHLRLSGPIPELSTTSDVLQDFFMSPDSDFRDGWITIYNQFSPSPKRFSRRTTTPLHIICCFDISLSNNEDYDTFSKYHDVKDHAGRTPLSLACEMGHVELCHLLIVTGADYRIRDEVYGQTALGWAIAEGHKEIVQLLLRHGADPKDHLSGTAPLHLAIQRLDSALVELLLENGADARTLDNYTGWSALSLASSLGNTYIMSLLLAWGAEILEKDQVNGWTPLHHAIFKGRRPALNTLISSLSKSQIRRLKQHHISGPSSWVDRVLGYSLGGICCHGPGRRASDQLGAPSGMDGDRGNTQPSGRKSGKGRNKQTRNNSNYGDEDGDEDEDDPRIPPPDGANGHPRFACPYEKVCPEEHRCSPSGFPSMYRVKSHVLKKHEIKRCWTCCRPFREEVDLRNHTRECDRRELSLHYEKGFDGTQRDGIKATKTADFPSEAHHWRRIFKLCFPNWESEIPDPYHNDIGARILNDETLTRIIEIGPDRNALRSYLGRVVESTNLTIPNIGRLPTLQDAHHEPNDLNAARLTPHNTVTDSANWQTPINYEQPSATASQDVPYPPAGPVEHGTQTYAPLLIRPDCTLADGSLTGFSDTSASHPRDFSSAMSQSINSPEPGPSIDGDHFSLHSRSDTSNRVNTRHSNVFMGVPQRYGSESTGHLAAPRMNSRSGTIITPTAQEDRTNLSLRFQPYTTRASHRDQSGYGQPSISWDSNDSRHMARQRLSEPLSYMANSTSPNYAPGGASYGQGLFRSAARGMQQGNTESQDVPMNLDDIPHHAFQGYGSSSSFYG